MTRRSFFARVAAAVAAVKAAPVVRACLRNPPIPGTVGAIERATYTFWRNQTPLTPPTGTRAYDLFFDDERLKMANIKPFDGVWDRHQTD